MEPGQDILPVLQTISNFSSGPNHYVEILLDADFLNHIGRFIIYDTPSQLRRNAILTIANLAAGNEKTTRKVVYHVDIMQHIISHISIPGCIFEPNDYKWVVSSKSLTRDKKEEWKILKESLWVLSNITTLADDDSIWFVYITAYIYYISIFNAFF